MDTASSPSASAILIPAAATSRLLWVGFGPRVPCSGRIQITGWSFAGTPTSSPIANTVLSWLA
ncbi:hypothetical protein Pmi06nite_14600 [Planotetraspora mira]|uniref:Uncharacterized protein n=1 Tax=Planotetraspora mira TaxID=58121 RepID=A0A8J3TKB5_9ACTN|nr:hypothetical protein Pmi06nite_14600 [Planotetraspora mira]